MVGSLTSNQDVAGSSPVLSSQGTYVVVAQLAGHLVANEEVAGSIPVNDSNVPGGLCELSHQGSRQKMVHLRLLTVSRTGVRHPGHSLRRCGREARQRPAKPWTPVQIRPATRTTSKYCNGRVTEWTMVVGCKPTAKASQVRILVLPRKATTLLARGVSTPEGRGPNSFRALH